jgi:hypothetical protein
LRRLRLLLVSVTLALPALAQYSADKPLGASAQSVPAYLKDAGLEQRLGTQMPLNLKFHDSTGADAPLGRYFTQKPVALALVYFKCAMLCPQVLHGLAASLAQTGYAPARDYDVVVASIDPTDTPADAEAARQKFVAQLGGMKNTAPISRPLADLSPLDLLKKIPVREAAALNDLSEDSFRRHYPHLIHKITPRRDVVALGDAISLPPKPA